MQAATADLIWPALALVFAGVFFALWGADRVRVHLLGFAAGFFFLFLAVVVHIAFPSLNTAFVTSFLHGLACLSVIAIVWGATRRLNQTAPLGAMLTISLVSVALLYPALATTKDTVALVVQNGASGLLFGIGAITLWLARPMNLLDRVLIWTMAAIAAFGLVRPAFLVLIEVEVAQLVQRQSAFNAISVVIITALTVVLAVSLIAIVVREAIEIRHRDQQADPVSGFLDQRTFQHACDAAIGNAHRLGLPTTLAVFEIDRFESFREEWGPDTSNLVVRDLSDVLRACRRDGDIVGRIDNNRFGVLLVGMGTDSGLKLAISLRDQVKRKWVEMVTGMIDVTLSCGIVECRPGANYHDIAGEAFSSLKHAKSVGSNCIFVNGRQFVTTELGEREAGSIIAHG